MKFMTANIKYKFMQSVCIRYTASCDDKLVESAHANAAVLQILWFCYLTMDNIIWINPFQFIHFNDKFYSSQFAFASYDKIIPTSLSNISAMYKHVLVVIIIFMRSPLTSVKMRQTQKLLYSIMDGWMVLSSSSAVHYIHWGMLCLLCVVHEFYYCSDSYMQ